MMLQGVPTPPTPPSPPFDPNLIFLSQQGGPPIALLIVIAALTAAVIILWPIMRAFGRRLEGRGGADVALRGEVDQLQARMSEMDSLQNRVAELEERVDFTERLLAQAHDAQGKVLRGETP